ncbi:glycerophosphodiester phosphodiesterase [Nakamurella sp. YIM 132087]|uniref:Glycerophosphodiester phosphodiesterase n=1 Tax=Nakamurella alba TaxID=2665158 RepID=A0A7K1FUG1_9ACTN|nr:glycerophosphodiester phosphodiesterase family protein [Nakamurella alba]MTD16833.1 glycerophosphodiester phosphodiesterase [Nakamurella alba]
MTAFLDGSGPRAFAHRGWHCDELAGCENSMAAFRRAVDEGFRYLETDVHVTADGTLIAFHDLVLDRVTDQRGLVAHTPDPVIERARIGGRQPIPLFAEVLDLMREHPQVRVNVDPKTDAAVGPLLDALRGSGLVDRICVGSFSDARLKVLRQALGPDLATSTGPREVARLVGRARWMPGRSRPPRPRGAFTRPVATQVPIRFGKVPVLDRRFVERAHLEGLEVHVWTIDDPAEMHRLLDLGVDGLMTDRPDVLRDVLRARGSWD